METTIAIDTDILNKAMLNKGQRTQKQLIEDALTLITAQNSQNEVRKYRGKLRWEGNLDELRASKWSL